MDWYYTAGNEQKGPVSEAELQQLARDGVITAQTHVWKAGLAAWEPATGHPALAGLIPTSAGPPAIPAAEPDRASNAVATIIPFKNVPALVGYYLGVFGLIPAVLTFGIGGIFGIVPLILGIVGLKKANANPSAKGRAHAWIAISLGSIELLAAVILGTLLLSRIASQG